MVSGNDVGANLAAAEELIDRAANQGAVLVALPENFALMADDDRQRLAAAEDDGDGPIQAFLAEAARRYGVWLVGGTIPLKGNRPNKVRSACLVVDADGNRAARYDKIHLFDVTLASGESYRESQGIEAGDTPVVVDTPAGRLGLAVCYDLRFPELFRSLLDRGAQLFVLPSAFTAVTGKAHWHPLVRARAIENLAYVIAPDQGGTHPNGRATYGHTLIVGPWGELLAELETGAGVVTAAIDPERFAGARDSLPSIHHRRLRT
jgi:predicted amidohydrolase